jgi:anti-sigma regulatory factor (Ser/Thr protein kinase)
MHRPGLRIDRGTCRGGGAMSQVIAVSVELNADSRNVRHARQVLRGALVRNGAADGLVDSATLVLSEIITNAFVHAGTGVRVHVWSMPHAVRVEVEDGAPHLPTRRSYADTAGTGRGLQLLDALVDRWGTTAHGAGKTVWFEIGTFDTDVGSPVPAHPAAAAVPSNRPAECAITLRRVPLLMHVAWQEHAAALLREYLLHVLDHDHDILEKHARASEALSLLNDQLPAPELSDEADALMSGSCSTCHPQWFRLSGRSTTCWAPLSRLQAAVAS